MVSATTNFYQAAINLQKVYQEQQRIREFSRSARTYHQEQKIRTLQEFSRYEFLFSESYQRLQECGSTGIPSDLWDLEITTIVQAGDSFDTIYRAISREFDRRIREIQADPTGSDRLISKYEKDLIQVYNDFGSGCLDIIRENFGNAADITAGINKFQDKLMKSVRRMLKKQVPKFWQQGVTWAEISIQQAKKREEYKKPDIYIKANQDAIDALIERNLGFIKGMTEDAKKGMLAELTEGMIRGEGIDQLVKRISKYTDTEKRNGQSRAERIARTEVMYGLNAGTISRYKKDGIEKVQWLAGPDDRCCDTCINNNGKVFPINTAPSLPAHPNCRCVWTGYFETNKSIEDWADEYRYAEKENWAIYDKDGNIVGTGSGDETSARVTGDVKDRTLIHNHPGQYADMSPGDFNFANKKDPAVMVITGENGTITIRRPDKGWPTQAEADAAWKKSQDEGWRVLESYRKKWKGGIWTLEEAEKRGKHYVACGMYENLGIVNFIDES